MRNRENRQLNRSSSVDILLTKIDFQNNFGYEIGWNQYFITSWLIWSNPKPGHTHPAPLRDSLSCFWLCEIIRRRRHSKRSRPSLSVKLSELLLVILYHPATATFQGISKDSKTFRNIIPDDREPWERFAIWWESLSSWSILYMLHADGREKTAQK